MTRKGSSPGKPRGNGALWRRRLRLLSGLYLMAFVTGHLVNHALGLVSLEAMERGRELFLLVWRNRILEPLLLLSLLVHMGTALARLARLSVFRLTGSEWIQILFGLLVPFLLARHMFATGLLSTCCNVEDSYAYVLNGSWPGRAGRQSLLLLLVWIHGCMGLHRWLRLNAGYRHLQPYLGTAAVLLPTLALAGFWNAGRELRWRQSADPGWLPGLARVQNWPDVGILRTWLDPAERWSLALFLLVVLLVLLVSVSRHLVARRNLVTVAYENGLKVRVPRGLTLLDASKRSGIPHASVCGGRGRCSTCRVRILDTGHPLPPPDAAESRVLERIGATPDVRLACQLPLTADCRVARLMPPAGSVRRVLQPLDPARGHERQLSVLFADLRGFTRLAEARLPYDTVFILNRYFAETGEAIEGAGGRIDKFIGDGIMALFGLEAPPEEAAGRSLRAAAGISQALDRLNRDLAGELETPLRIGIGIHAGTAIVGEMGHGRATQLTAIGDAVNVASRLEALTKELGVQLVVSTAVLELAGLPQDVGEPHQIRLRGRTGILELRAFADAREMPLPATPPHAGDPGRGLLDRWLPPRLRAGRHPARGSR